MENVISNAERRALRNNEKLVVPRVSDVYAALPAITGKLELEYEGEMKGADFVGRELIRAAIAKTYDEYFTGANVQQIVQWFDLGGEIQLSDAVSALEALDNLKNIQGLIDKLGPLGVSQKESPEQQVSAAEFILEGLHAHKRNHRTGREDSLIKFWSLRHEAAASMCDRGIHSFGSFCASRGPRLQRSLRGDRMAGPHSGERCSGQVWLLHAWFGEHVAVACSGGVHRFCCIHHLFLSVGKAAQGTSATS
jgi:hypothetical protein